MNVRGLTRASGPFWNWQESKIFDTFASWYMMNGGDLYELAKILGHSNIEMTESVTPS